MASVVAVALALGSLTAGCAPNELGGLEVSTQVVATSSTSATKSVAQGTAVQVQITITNVGQNSIGGVTARVAVPSGFSYLDTVSTAVNGNSERSADVVPDPKDSALTWGAWTMGPGALGNKSQVLITFDLEASGAPATSQLSPQVFATGYGNTLSGIPLSLTVAPAPALNLQLVVSPSAVAAGGLITYHLVLTNNGSGAASLPSSPPSGGLGVTLPNGFDYAGAVATAGNAGTSGATYPTVGSEGPVWSGFDIPGKSSSGPGTLSLTFQVLVLAIVPGGIYTASASVVASTGSQTGNYLQQNYTALAPVQVTGP